MNIYNYGATDPLNSTDPSGLLECFCKGKCKKGMKDYAPQLNKYIRMFIEQELKMASDLAWKNKYADRYAHLKRIRQGLASDEKDFAYLWWIMKNATTKIENFIHRDVLKGHGGIIEGGRTSTARVNMAKYTIRGSTTVADCIFLKCGGKNLCIGSDKIGHFFQQGYMGWQLLRQKSYEHAVMFFYWTEGGDKLVESTSKHGKGQWKEAAIWIINDQSVFKFDFYTETKMSNWKARWGGQIRSSSLFPVRVEKSMADIHANKAGMMFYEQLAQMFDLTTKEGANRAFNYKSTFDICDYVVRMG